MKYLKRGLLLLLLLSRFSRVQLCNPIDGSPRLPRPWDSPDKNTGVGCHFLLQCRKVKSKSEVAQSCPTRSSVHGIFQVRVLEWGAISYSGGVFPTQGSKPCLLHLRLWQADSLPLVPPVKPLSDLSLANVCFYSVGCLFILLMISFAVQKLF